MAIKQSRYITVDTTVKKDMAIRTTELDKVKDDPFVRKSEVQQTVNNSTLPVSSRAVNLAINSIEIPSLDGYATEDYVDDELESVNSRVDLIDEKATEAKAGADRAEQAVSDSVGSGRLMREGAYGVGDNSALSNQISKKFEKGIYYSAASDDDYFNAAPERIADNIVIGGFAGSAGGYIFIGRDGRLFVRGRARGILGDFREAYTTANTTVDSNGFIKQASPIIKLFNERIEANDSFKGEPEFKKIDTGVYQISGTLGLAKEGWYIETPRDRNGFPYFLVEWEQDENNVVTIRTFKRKIDLETLDFVNGEPVDIGEDQRWIDLRFHEEEADDEELHSQLDNLDESAH